MHHSCNEPTHLCHRFGDRNVTDVRQGCAKNAQRCHQVVTGCTPGLHRDDAEDAPGLRLKCDEPAQAQCYPLAGVLYVNQIKTKSKGEYAMEPKKIITKEELKNSTKREKMELMSAATGYTTDNQKADNDFRKHFGTEFSYADLRNAILGAGGVQGWYYPDELRDKFSDEIDGPVEAVDTDVIELHRRPDEDLVRKTVRISSDLSKEWDEFCRSSLCGPILLEAAIRRFMADAKSGKVSVVHKFT